MYKLANISHNSITPTTLTKYLSTTLLHSTRVHLALKTCNNTRTPWHQWILKYTTIQWWNGTNKKISKYTTNFPIHFSKDIYFIIETLYDETENRVRGVICADECTVDSCFMCRELSPGLRKETGRKIAAAFDCQYFKAWKVEFLTGNFM